VSTNISGLQPATAAVVIRQTALQKVKTGTWLSSEMRLTGCRNTEVWPLSALALAPISLISPVRVNVVSGLLVGCGVYIQLCVAILKPFVPNYSADCYIRDHPAIFIIYSLICTLCYCIVNWSLSDSCGLACSLTVLVFLANSTFENWPDWRRGDNEPITVIYITGILIMLGVKGYELSH